MTATKQTWQRIDSTTAHDGWTIGWYLDQWDDVYVTSIVSPTGYVIELPAERLSLKLADEYFPAAVIAQVRAEKFDHCPRMKAFLRNCRVARESWEDYYTRREIQY